MHTALEDVTIPPLYCPLDVAVSPYRDSLHDASVDWAREMGIAPRDSAAARYLDAARLSDLAAFTMPYLTRDDLVFAARFCVWLFLHDDYYVDDAGGDNDERALRAVHAQIVAVLDGRPDHVGDPIAIGLRDLYDRVATRTDAAWVQRFVHTLKAYLQANDWERRIRVRQIAPDVSTYTKMRLFIGAVYPVFVFINIANGVDAGARFLRQADVRVLSEMANNHICWVNDVLGFRKELRERNPSNLVLVLRREYALTLQEAVTRAAEMADKEMRAFLQLRDLLPSFGAVEDRQVRAYVTAMELWMAGHLAWAQASERYRSKGSASVPSVRVASSSRILRARVASGNGF
jgi:5-epi-alpha-selinene synthase